MGVVALGLLTCLLAMLLAGRIRCVRGRDAVGGSSAEAGALGPHCVLSPPQALHRSQAVVT